MKAKDYFQTIWRTEQTLKACMARLRHYEELGLTITSNTSAVGGHQAGTSRVEAAVVGMVDTQAALEIEIAGYRGLIAEAERRIKAIPQENYRKILTYRYLCGWSFRSISDELGYNDPNSIYRAHGWALLEAQKIIDAEDKAAGVWQGRPR